MANTYTDENGHVIYTADTAIDANELAEMLEIDQSLAEDIITDAWGHLEKMQDQVLNDSIAYFLHDSADN